VLRLLHSEKLLFFRNFPNYEWWRLSGSGHNGALAFDPAASDISEDFEEKVFGFDSLDEKDFLEFAYNRLLRIAGDPADRRREWLRSFLAKIPASGKVRKLGRLLDERKRTLQGR
jgi:hypothetical protein